MNHSFRKPNKLFHITGIQITRIEWDITLSKAVIQKLQFKILITNYVNIYLYDKVICSALKYQNINNFVVLKHSKI